MKKAFASSTVAVVLGTLLLAQAPRASAQVLVSDPGGSSNAVGAGIVTLGLSYGAAAIVAANSSREADKRLFVPVVGPWLDLADRGSCPVSNSACDHETTDKILIIGDGVIQAVGALSLLGGLMAPTRTIASVGSVKIAQIAPVSLGRGEPGLAAVGRF